MSRRDRIGALLALTLGAVFGVLFGLFFDPDAFKETLERMRKKREQLKDNASETLKDVKLGD